MTICFLISFLACVIGKICGMGGGVIIKPVLDAVGLLNVGTINFLSSCTVTGMSLWSVVKSVFDKSAALDWKVSTLLGTGAAAGGILGKYLFSRAAACFAEPDMAGGVQAALLFAATLATLIYTIFKDRLPNHHMQNLVCCGVVGCCLGALGAFLGIGGGPFNMAALFFFFSMPAKTAALNSLYIILISQLAGLGQMLLAGAIPPVAAPLLLGMIACGILGSEVGRRLNRHLQDRTVTRLLELSMLLVMGISVYNMVRNFV